MTSLHRV